MEDLRPLSPFISPICFIVQLARHAEVQRSGMLSYRTYSMSDRSVAAPWTGTLMLHPASTTHRQLTPEQRAAAGAGDDVLRISIGLETVPTLFSEIQYPYTVGGRSDVVWYSSRRLRCKRFSLLSPVIEFVITRSRRWRISFSIWITL